MATDLTQEFCALRDTYIEKQFGRLNEMQRRAVFTLSLIHISEPTRH